MSYPFLTPFCKIQPFSDIDILHACLQCKNWKRDIRFHYKTRTISPSLTTPIWSLYFFFLYIPFVIFFLSFLSKKQVYAHYSTIKSFFLAAFGGFKCALLTSWPFHCSIMKMRRVFWSLCWALCWGSSHFFPYTYKYMLVELLLPHQEG